MDCASLVNQYIDTHKPWVLAKEKVKKKKFKIFVPWFEFIPNSHGLFETCVTPYGTKSRIFSALPPFRLGKYKTAMLNASIETFVSLLQRIEKTKIDLLLSSQLGEPK